MHYMTYDSPVGPLLLIGQGEALCGLHFPDGRHPVTVRPEWREDPAPFTEVCRQLHQYFAGERRAFDLQLGPAGTDFQRRVWLQLRDIPYGQAISYGELARRVGDPNASRAVGAANGRNPISIIVPCHRVIGSSGSLVGFGGGVDTKRWLIDHECQHAGLFAGT